MFLLQAILLNICEVETMKYEIHNAADSGASAENAERLPCSEIGHHYTTREAADTATYY